DPERLRSAVGPDVALVSVMWVNNETGCIQPVVEIAAIAHAAGALYHCDAVQAAGKLPIQVKEAGADLLSLAAHKLHGPPGAAVLHELDRCGITVSTGSACTAASPGPSHVLTAMGLRPEDAHASVRFSLGAGNDEDQVDHILEATPPVIERLRGLAGSGHPEE